MKDFKIAQRLHNPTPNLSRYFSEVQKEKMLSPEKEAILAEKAKRGDMIAKEKLIKANLRFVVSVAKAYSSHHSPLEDLICEGNKGLLEASETFDPSSGFKFISYAVWHIRKNIFSYIANNSRQIRIPCNITQQLNRYKKAEDYFFATTGRNGTYQEISEIYEKSHGGEKSFPSSFEVHVNGIAKTVPLESPNEDDHQEKEFGPINWVSSGESTDSLIIKDDFKILVEDLMDGLTEQQREVIKMKYGISPHTEEMSFQQIGSKLNKSPEWVRLLVKKSEKIMKKKSKELEI